MKFETTVTVDHLTAADTLRYATGEGVPTAADITLKGGNAVVHLDAAPGAPPRLGARYRLTLTPIEDDE